MKTHLTASALALVMTVCTTAGEAQARNCGPRDTVVERLTNGYGETRQSIGIGANNSVIEVFASAETGTWTITVTMPTGQTCLVASGEAFELLDEELTPAGAQL